MLTRVQQLKAPARQMLTIPVSPAIQKPKTHPVLIDAPVVIKAKPVPVLKVFEPVISHRRIENCGYELPGDRIRERKLRDFKQIQSDQIEIARNEREFVANPIPAPEDFEVHHVVQVTEPREFFLETEVRGKLYKSSLEIEEAREAARRENMTKFHANEVPTAVFVPTKSNKPLTSTQDHVLATVTRNEERKAFDEQVRSRNDEEIRIADLLKAKNEVASQFNTRLLRTNRLSG